MRRNTEDGKPMIGDPAEELGAPARNLVLDEESDSDSLKDTAVHCGEYGVVRDRGNEGEKVGKQSEHDGRQKTAEDELPTHEPEAENENGNIDDDDKDARGETGQNVNEGGGAADPAAHDFAGNEEYADAQGVTDTAENHKEISLPLPQGKAIRFHRSIIELPKEMCNLPKKDCDKR